MRTWKCPECDHTTTSVGFEGDRDPRCYAHNPPVVMKLADKATATGESDG